MLLGSVDILMPQNIRHKIDIARLTVQSRTIRTAQFMRRDLLCCGDLTGIFLNHILDRLHPHAPSLRRIEESVLISLCRNNMLALFDPVFQGSFNLITHTLSTQGITNTIVKVNDLEALESAIQPNTKAVYAETFGNPNSDVTNIEAVAEVAHRHHIPLIIDNTFGTPFLIRPIEHGADVVVHSATKFLGGHGSSLGGVIVDGGTFNWKANADKYPSLAKPDPSYHGAVFADVAGAAAFVTRIRAVILRDTGSTISPFNAWILLQGLETLSLRVERHVENALKVVDFLANHPKVAHVNHPSLASHPDHELYKKYFPQGGGSIFTFEIKGGQDEAWKFIDSLKIFSLLANVADVKSLVIHPYTTTHSQMSSQELEEQHITPSTIRLSIGTEHIDDIIDDLTQAFEQI